MEYFHALTIQAGIHILLGLSVYTVALTGQVATSMIGSDAFQEADVYGMSIPCTKYNYLVKEIADLPRVIREAFHIARSGRPGPVLIDVPKDIQIDSETASKGGMVRVRRGKENFQVQIPSGTWKRMSLRIPDKGESSLFGKRRGDLILNIHVLPGNEVCEGDTNFYYDLQISRGNIENGGVQSLETVQGVIKFVLPKTTRHGQSFVLKARTSSNAVLRTNHVVTVQLI